MRCGMRYMEMKWDTVCVRWGEMSAMRTMVCYKIYDVIIKHVNRIKHKKPCNPPPLGEMHRHTTHRHTTHRHTTHWHTTHWHTTHWHTTHWHTTHRHTSMCYWLWIRTDWFGIRTDWLWNSAWAVTTEVIATPLDKAFKALSVLFIPDDLKPLCGATGRVMKECNWFLCRVLTLRVCSLNPKHRNLRVCLLDNNVSICKRLLSF